MRFVVSANYRDRFSPQRWLIRQEDQSPAEAVPFTSAACRGVTFSRSELKEELGFDCRMVAVAEEAVGMNEGDPESLSTVLQFDGWYDFFDVATRDRVTQRELNQLNLHSNGQITAILRPLATEAPAPDAELAAV